MFWIFQQSSNNASMLACTEIFMKIQDKPWTIFWIQTIVIIGFIAKFMWNHQNFYRLFSLV